MVPADSRRISRVLRYSGVAWISKNGFAYGAVTLCGRASLRVRLPLESIAVGNPTTPGGASPRPRFGLFRFRSPLLAESLLFSLPAGTEMFQFPAFAPASAGDGIAPAGFPHSEIRASTGICPLTRLFAAYHVLLRLREPQASPMRPSSFSFYFRLCARRSLRFDLRSLLLLLTQSVARLFHLRFHHVNVLLFRSPRQS